MTKSKASDAAEDAPPPAYSADEASLGYASDDTTIIPKGALDPVYESKARVINRAVSRRTLRQLVMSHLRATGGSYVDRL